MQAKEDRRAEKKALRKAGKRERKAVAESARDSGSNSKKGGGDGGGEGGRRRRRRRRSGGDSDSSEDDTVVRARRVRLEDETVRLCFVLFYLLSCLCVASPGRRDQIRPDERRNETRRASRPDQTRLDGFFFLYSFKRKEMPFTLLLNFEFSYQVQYVV